MDTQLIKWRECNKWIDIILIRREFNKRIDTQLIKRWKCNKWIDIILIRREFNKRLDTQLIKRWECNKWIDIILIRREFNKRIDTILIIKWESDKILIRIRRLSSYNGFDNVFQNVDTFQGQPKLLAAPRRMPGKRKIAIKNSAIYG